MAQIGILISELLQDNDCVIVPKMGGFLNADTPGIPKLDNNHTHLSSKISFNTFLTYNDGLLANHMMKKEKLSYNEALNEIEKFVGEFQKEIDAGGKFMIEPLGILYKDARLNFQIEPYKISSGVIEKQVVPEEPVSKVFAEIVEEKILVQEKVDPETPSVLPEPKRKVISRSKKVVLILVGVILTVGLFIYFFPPPDLNIISSDSKPNQKDKIIQEPTVEIQQTDPTINIVNRNSKNAVNSNSSVKNESPSEPVVISEPAVTNEIAPEGKYFIIAGSFKSEENANKKMEELKSMGFENTRYFPNDRQLLLVYFDSFDSRKDAMESMSLIREKFKIEAWIYTR